ncbi:MAG: YceD family protein [Halioglobus sp.]
MLTETLPSSLDVRKAATRGVSVSGTLKPLELQRFRELLAEDVGTLLATLTFSRDEENRYLIEVSVSADVSVTCQRCLEPMPLRLQTDNQLAVVWDDEYARQLPRSLDALIVADEPCNLWAVVEEELILGMPAFSYHEAEDCNKILAGISAPPPEDGEDGGKPNPFNVLAQLKPGNKH